MKIISYFLNDYLKANIITKATPIIYLDSNRNEIISNKASSDKIRKYSKYNINTKLKNDNLYKTIANKIAQISLLQLIIIITLISTTKQSNLSVNSNTSLNTSTIASNKSLSLLKEITYSSCKINTPDNKYSINLNSLNNSVDYRLDIQGYSYKANFCSSLISKCGGTSTPAALFDISGLCLGPFTSNWENISVHYISEENHNEGIKLIFNTKGGQCPNSYNNLLSLTYTLKCDESFVDASLESLLKIDSCNYNFVFHTNAVCFHLQSSLMSILIKFEAIFMIILLCYLVFFTYFNYKKNPEDGVIKAFPNRDFWVEFIDCVIVGIKISFKYIIGLFRKN